MRLAEMGRHLSWKRLEYLTSSSLHVSSTVVFGRFYHTQIEEMPMDIADLI